VRSDIKRRAIAQGGGLQNGQGNSKIPRLSCLSFLCDPEKTRGVRVRRSESNRSRSRKFHSRCTCRCETARRLGRCRVDRGRMQIASGEVSLEQERESVAREYSLRSGGSRGAAARRGWPGTPPTGGRARSRTTPRP
jgi:hypothetical protein